MSEETKPPHDCGAGVYWRIEPESAQSGMRGAVTFLICVVGISLNYSSHDQIPWWTGPVNWAAGSILTYVFLRAPWRGLAITLWAKPSAQGVKMRDHDGVALNHLVVTCTALDMQGEDVNGDT